MAKIAKEKFPGIHFLNILRLFDLSKILLSPQWKRLAIITYKHGIYELPHDLPKDLIKTSDVRKLGNIRKMSKLHRMIA